MTATQRKTLIRSILKECGGETSIKEISERTGLNVNGLSQTLGVMSDVRESLRENDGVGNGPLSMPVYISAWARGGYGVKT